ncbi:MAG: DUF433 domain-containing protein [Gammaproteobacteria bacterium]
MIEWRLYIISDPQICRGELCAKGTRVLLTNILDSLAEGASREDILRSYPSLAALARPWARSRRPGPDIFRRGPGTKSRTARRTR